MKRILYTLACLMLGISAWAQNVAKIGDTEYATLADAVAAATDGQAITLLEDITENNTIAADKNVIIDLNGHNITVAAAKAAFTNYGTLKIQGDGNVTRSDNRGYVIDNQGTIVLAGGNYKKIAGTSMNALLRNAGTMTISGGTYYAKYKNDVSADNIYSSNTVGMEGKNPTATITGGSFLTSTNGFDDGVVVTGGSFTTKPEKNIPSGYGFEKNADGKYVPASGYVVKDNKQNYYKTLAEAFTTATTYLSLIADIEEDITIPSNATTNYLYLNNHKVTGNITNNAVKTLILGESSTAKATSENGIVAGTLSSNILVIGGKYVNNPSANVNKYEYKTSQEGDYYVVVDKTADEKAAALAADGIVATTGSGSTIAYFTSVQAAWNASTSTTSCPISLVADVTEDVTRVKNSAPILKLEGHSFTGKMDTRVESANKYFNINGVGTATLTEVYCGNMTIDSKANVIIEGGNVTGTLTVKSGCSLTIKGGTFKNDPTAYVAEGYMVVTNPDGSFTVKEKDYVAQIGNKKYESLAEAIATAENGETVTLLADVTDNIVIPADKNITLDLNEKTLNGKRTANTPTIKNFGTLTVKNGNVRRTGEGSASWYVIENEGTITMDEGLNVEGSASSSLIRNNAATAQMTFNAGTYTQTGAFIVVKNDLGNVVINGGTFSTASDKNVLNNWDQMTINGGTFTGNIFNGAYDTDNNKLTINDGTFNASQIRTYLGNGKTSCPIEIKGGTFTNAQMKYVGTGNTESDTDVQVAVSGGTFANAVPEKYCAEGFSPVTTPDSEGMYTVETTKVAMIGDARYASLEEAVEAATDGAIIKLIRDGLKYEYVEPRKVITLDLNGFTYDCNIDNYGTLTIVDNSEEGTGKLVNTKKHWIVWNNPSAKLTVQSGTIAFETRANAKSDTGQQAIVNEGSLIINGGTIDGYTADYNTGIADSYTDTYAVENISGEVTINGGKLMGLHSLSTFGGTSAVINDGQFIVPFGPGTNAVYNYTDDLTVYIKGGTFIGDTDFLINKNDNSNGSFCITGGKFYKYDPQHSKSENPIANFVPKEYAAQKDADGYYVIVPAIAYIDEMGYAVLDIAIEEAKEAESATTITLLANAETEKEILPANVTINANENVLTMPSFVVLDGEAFALPNVTGADTYKVRTATYIRTNIASTVWGTVCLPFSLTSGNGADYYTYNNISGSTLTVDETTTVDPNTPVVFKKTKGGDLEINEEDAIVSLKASETSLVNGALVGTYTDANIPADGKTYFLNGNQFHQAQVSVKVPMYRAYIKYAAAGGAAPRALSIVVGGGDDATAIGTLTTGDADIEAIYDAAGRKLQAPQKGMNIMKLANGKTVKLIVK